MHKISCVCCACKSKRGEYKGINNPHYKNGFSLLERYCIDCGNKVSNGITKRCQICHLKKLNNSHTNYKGGRYCIDCHIKIKKYGAKRCKSCYGKSKKGLYVNEKSPNWKGGRSLLTVLPKYIRLQVFERDNYICQVCNKRGSIRLDSHHIIPKVLYSLNYIKESNKLYNLITLCRGCHNWIHDKLNIGEQSHER
ncbi:MAG: HNH endonuclease [Patescibacteria group bacterium]